MWDPQKVNQILCECSSIFQMLVMLSYISQSTYILPMSIINATLHQCYHFPNVSLMPQYAKGYHHTRNHQRWDLFIAIWCGSRIHLKDLFPQITAHTNCLSLHSPRRRCQDDLLSTSHLLWSWPQEILARKRRSETGTARLSIKGTLSNKLRHIE